MEQEKIEKIKKVLKEKIEAFRDADDEYFYSGKDGEVFIKGFKFGKYLAYKEILYLLTRR